MHDPATNGVYWAMVSLSWVSKRGMQIIVSKSMKMEKKKVTIFEILLLARYDGHDIILKITSPVTKLVGSKIFLSWY